jgi:hypothetical protein
LDRPFQAGDPRERSRRLALPGSDLGHPLLHVGSEPAALRLAVPGYEQNERVARVHLGGDLVDQLAKVGAVASFVQAPL